jgi:hypothetical protein
LQKDEAVGDRYEEDEGEALFRPTKIWDFKELLT